MSKPVLFVSFRPLARAENLRAIYDAYDGPKVHICTHDRGYEDEVRSGKYDLMVIDEFPSVTPGKCIMIWHGIQGGKYIGLDQPRTPYYSLGDRDKMTYVIAASQLSRRMWAQCTGLPDDRILPLGMPRTDAFIGKHKGDGHTVLATHRSYLYVPTFRDCGETPMPRVDWERVDSLLNDNEILAIKLHPWVVNRVPDILNVKRFRHIIKLPPSEPSAPYLYDCDVVITDYSSIMFDGYLLGKPCVLFEKNPGYTTTRGMYMAYPQHYSSRYATTEQDMISLARDANGLTQTEISCLRVVAESCDGHACERLCSLISRLNGGDHLA